MTFAPGEEIVCVAESSLREAWNRKPFPLVSGKTYICAGECEPYVTDVMFPDSCPFIYIVGYPFERFSHLLFRPLRYDADDITMEHGVPIPKFITLEEYSRRILKELGR